jgi:glycosyltransferase involved in cell wall biosynthesis
MKLLIISHTPHYYKQGQIVGWGPTVREINQIATLFDHIEHLAPLHLQPAPVSALPYTDNRLSFTPVKPAGGDNLWHKLGILVHIPGWLKEMRRAMRAADAVHIRCPAGISLVAVLVTRFWAKDKPVWVKYAGNWHFKGYVPLSSRIQRNLLRKNFHQGAVSVNGLWPEQPRHVITFNNPSMSLQEYEFARQKTRGKTLCTPIQLLFVGRIDKAKGVDRLLEIANELKLKGLDFELTLVGDSPQRKGFEIQVRKNQLSSQVHFAGWQTIALLSKYYEKAHLLLFPSTSEGWPKVLSEGMAYGVVPIASAVGSIPQILAEFNCGKAIPPDDIMAFVYAVLEYTQMPQTWSLASKNGQLAGCEFTYEKYLSAVKDLFDHTWKIDISYE